MNNKIIIKSIVLMCINIDKYYIYNNCFTNYMRFKCCKFCITLHININK